ncbi:MAG: aminodeoxychorismate/anthranilate synthase component II [Ignavibacterium sp.]|nr:aminodeoxychorismate/anthranilate synthase component II [Ignavibacterium sp.]
MQVLIIDNYDSFTFNLVQLVGKLVKNVIVKRNDEISLKDVLKINPDKILISPGPGKPENSKISLDVIRKFYNQIPILGVCLGHQAIGICFGAEVKTADYLMHGKTSKISHDGKKIFENIPQKFNAMRYHSLIVDKSSVKEPLEITAYDEKGFVMGIRHKNFPLEGVQFHPESILTEFGEQMIRNWLKQN